MSEWGCFSIGATQIGSVLAEWQVECSGELLGFLAASESLKLAYHEEHALKEVFKR